MRVVVDSNVLVRVALKSTKLAPIQIGWKAGRYVLLGSDPLFDELAAVLSRGKFRHLITSSEVTQFLDDLREVVEWLALDSPYPNFSDPDDAFLLAMIQAGEADMPVTGDKALLELGRFETAAIISPRRFLDRLEDGPEP